MVSVWACDDDKDDNEGGSCTAGATQCTNDGKLQVCVNGSWGPSTNCGSDKVCKVVDNIAKCVAAGTPECTDGQKQCTADGIPQICAGGKWTTLAACESDKTCKGGNCLAEGQECVDNDKQCSNDGIPQLCTGGKWANQTACDADKTCDKGDCVAKGGQTGDDPKEGDACDKSTFKKVCSKDGNYVFDCGSESTIFKKACEECTINASTNRYECKDNRADCTASSTEACKGACSSDNKTGYYWSQGLKTVDCSAKSDCTVNGSRVECGTTSTTCDNPVTTGGNVGDCCDKNTYQQTCTNSNANALVCWDGKVTQWTCANNNCAPNTEKPLQVTCEKGSTQTTCDNPVTTGGSEGDCCDRNTYQQSCINSNANALVCWDGKVTKWTCANNNCAPNSEKPLQVSCEKGSSSTTCENTVTTGGNEGDCCDRDTYQQTCINSGANALVCWDGKVTKWTCANSECSANTEKPLQVVCQKGGSSTNDKANPNNEDRTKDAACNETTYFGACSDDWTKRYYCKDGKIVETACNTGSVCDPTSLGNNSSKCKTNTSDLPECAKSENATCTTCQNVCDGLNGYYCDTKNGNVIRKKACSSSCIVEGNSVKCDSECNGTNVTTGGKVGDCCDPDTYKPTGCDTALRCNSAGVVVKWTCPSAKEPTKTKCAYDPNDTTYKGGTFSCVAP